MNTERKTTSILQRVPVILAVTAASYGLQLPPHIAARTGGANLVGTSALGQPDSGVALAQLPAPPAKHG